MAAASIADRALPELPVAYALQNAGFRDIANGGLNCLAALMAPASLSHERRHRDDCVEENNPQWGGFDAIIESVKLPHGEKAIIDPRKLVRYSLNPDHEDGRHKARLFKNLVGVTLDNAALMLDALRLAAIE